jgi:hypothetical protein
MRLLFLMGLLISADAFGQSADLFPMNLGRTWIYNVTRIDGSPGGCSTNGKLTRSVTSAKTENNLPTATIKSDPWCWGGSSETKHTFDGAYITVNQFNLLKLPPVKGDVWAAGFPSGAEYTWLNFHPTFRVAAGSFTDCWEMKQVGYEVRSVYCKDIGMILFTQNSWGINERWELAE